MSVAPDDGAAKLLAKVIDRIDRVLFEHSLQFKVDADWETFADAVRDLIFKYYDDHDDDVDDADYDPDAVDTSSSQSESLESGTDEQKRARKA